MANHQKNSKNNREKADWFEALCSLGEDRPAARKNTKGARKSATADKRVRVQNRSDDPFSSSDRPPFDDNDIPPFDPAEESVADMLFGTGDKKKSSRKKTKSAADGKGGKSRRDGAAKQAPSRRQSSKTTERDEPHSVADAIRFIQPYAVFVLGVFVAIEMLLAFVMSGGRWGWTPTTHPFRFVGYYLEYFLFGMLGYGAYLLPALMMYLSFDRLHNGKRQTGKGIMASGIVLLLPAVIQVCLVNAEGSLVPNTYRIGELYTSGAAHNSAGVLPGLLAYVSNVGLGVIGTVIIGVFLLLLLGLLLLGLTPAVIWDWLREVIDTSREKRSRARDRELEMRQERGLAPKQGLLRGNLDAEQRAEADLDRRIGRRLDREQEKMAQQALREADRSDRLEQAKQKGRRGKDVRFEETEDEFDPVDVLIRRSAEAKGEDDADQSRPNVPGRVGGKSDKKQAKEPTFEPADFLDFADEDSDDAASAVFDEVRDLPEEEDPAFDKQAKPTAASAPLEIQPAEEDSLNLYPTHAEIELDMDDPMPEEDEYMAMFRAKNDKKEPRPAAEAEQAAVQPADLEEFYRDLDGVDFDDDGESVTMQGDGGVTIQVKTLSEQEKARGSIIVTPEKKEEYARVRPYVFPNVELLNPEPTDGGVTEAMLQHKAVRLRDTLSSFNVRVEGVTYVGGPTVTRYEVKPAPGVKVASITRLSDDIAMGLEATGAVRIEAPIPGKNAVGIEVPNDKRSTVYLRELIDADSFRTAKSRVTCCLGKGVGGMSVYLDINKMPHLLIAGATGTGKSVCINSLIMSLLYKAKPDEVKLLLIDPKTVEFSVYKDIPHLMAPIICDPKRAAGALNLAVQEMEHRFELLRTVGVRDLSSYNAVTENDRYEHPYIPQMVIIIDELADLMMTAKNEVETSIVRLAQKARAAGIHLVLGTQRPSVDVITGLIKANVPSRISFTVTSRVDSATILDNAGAEKLLGMGDMLYSPIGSSKPQRVQGCFVSDGEVEKIVEFIKRHNDEVRYDKNFLENLDREAELIGNKKESRDDYGDDGDLGDLDPKFYEALGIAIKNKRISTSLLQRAISVGYGRAAKILDQMEEKGFIGPASGNKPREILISEEAYRELMINQD